MRMPKVSGGLPLKKLGLWWMSTCQHTKAESFNSMFWTPLLFLKTPGKPGDACLPTASNKGVHEGLVPAVYVPLLISYLVIHSSKRREIWYMFCATKVYVGGADVWLLSTRLYAVETCVRMHPKQTPGHAMCVLSNFCTPFFARRAREVLLCGPLSLAPEWVYKDVDFLSSSSVHHTSSAALPRRWNQICLFFSSGSKS
jgi:hypothetical protein